MAKSILLRDDAREAVRRGVSQVTRAARGTLGPRGRHVILQQPDGSLLVTKDGVTVVEQIDLEDPFENVGVQLVKQVATTTRVGVGDGTTTATILAEAIFVEGLKAVAMGISPIGLEQGIRQAVRDLTAQLQQMSVPVQDKGRLQQVTTVASNGDHEIGELLAEVLVKAGEEGLVILEDGTAARTEVEWVEGIRFDRGFLSPYFVTHASSREARLEDAAVLICDHTLSALQDLLPLLERAVEAKRELLIVAGDVQGEALSSLVVNVSRGVLRCCAVKAPEFGDARRDVLTDLAVFTGGAAIFSDSGTDLKQIRLDDLGSAKRVVVTSDSTTIMDGAGPRTEIDGRIQQIDRACETASSAERTRLERRAAQLRGRVATIRVGATTESELHEKRARMDDALHAGRAAREEGIVPGGGVALLRAAAAVSPPDNKTPVGIGYAIVLRACQAPLVAIAENAGRSGTAACQRAIEGQGDFGYDAARNEFGPLMEAGIVDATKVVRQSLENAAGLAATLLGSDALITERRD